MQLFGKLDELINQLTSDEPKENVDASPAMLARQEQLRDAILSAAEQMQKESRTLLEELGQVGSSQLCACILQFFHSDEKSLSFPISNYYYLLYTQPTSNGDICLYISLSKRNI